MSFAYLGVVLRILKLCPPVGKNKYSDQLIMYARDTGQWWHTCHRFAISGTISYLILHILQCLVSLHLAGA